MTTIAHPLGVVDTAEHSDGVCGLRYPRYRPGFWPAAQTDAAVGGIVGGAIGSGVASKVADGANSLIHKLWH